MVQNGLRIFLQLPLLFRIAKTTICVAWPRDRHSIDMSSFRTLESLIFRQPWWHPIMDLSPVIDVIHDNDWNIVVSCSTNVYHYLYLQVNLPQPSITHTYASIFTHSIPLAVWLQSSWPERGSSRFAQELQSAKPPTPSQWQYSTAGRVSHHHYRFTLRISWKMYLLHRWQPTDD